MAYSDLLCEAAKGFMPPSKSYVQRGIEVTHCTISSVDAVKVARSAGEYITLMPSNGAKPENTAHVLSLAIKKLTRAVGAERGKVLVLGLGNNFFAADALGDATIKNVAPHKGNYDIVTFTPGVSGVTGIPSFDLVKAVIDTQKPVLALVIDTLATSYIERLGRCFQLTTAGISPGGGVGNAQPPLNVHSLGVPVIALGVPLVISVGSIFDSNNLPSSYADYMVTPRDVDALVREAASIISDAINSAFAD